MRLFARELEVRVLKVGETDEEAASSSQLLVLKGRGPDHFSRSHARRMGPVRQRNQSLDEAMNSRVS